MRPDRLPSDRPAGTDPRLWLLPAGFVIHDAEELVTMVDWIARRRAELDRWAEQGPLLGRLVDTVPSTPGEVAITMGLELALLVAVTAVAARDVRAGIRLYAYAAALGVFVVHAGTHLLQPAIFGGYTPGVVTAATVVPLVGVAIYRVLLGGGILSARAAAWSAAAGLAVFGPLFALFVRIARRLDPLL